MFLVLNPKPSNRHVDLRSRHEGTAVTESLRESQDSFGKGVS